MSWPQAASALKIQTGGYLHIHSNVDVGKMDKDNNDHKPEWLEWAKYAQHKIKELLESRNDGNNIKWSASIEHIEYVKSYGPRVDHLVLDLLCKPNI
jgi:tRNA G37 N-methylase Trm5